MAWIAPTIAAVGALGSAAIGSMKGTGQAQDQSDIAIANLANQKQNAAQQQLVQALINQRAIAGQADPFGGGLTYDPATNTWTSKLGPMPMAADTSAYQAEVNKNTVDQQQQALVNRMNMDRAARAMPIADAAQRQLANFRPMSYDDLSGLLTQQGIEAARQSYDPLRADVLRSVARTGTAAGPVLRQLGLGEAQNLRNTLRDSLISSLTSTDQINASRRASLENAAANANTLASPQIAQAGSVAPSAGTALSQLMAQRAQNAPSGSASSIYGTGIAGMGANTAAGTAIGNVPNPNVGLDQAQAGLKSLTDWAQNPNYGAQALYTSLFGGGGNLDAANPTISYGGTTYGTGGQSWPSYNPETTKTY